MQAIVFGHPFLLMVREGETMGEVKARIKAKLRTKDEDFETWKFAYVNNGASPKYIDDNEVVLNCFPVSETVPASYLLARCVLCRSPWSVEPVAALCE
jgi:hypothetical protein